MRHLLFAALLLLCCAYGCIADTRYGTPYPPDPDEDPIPETENSRIWGVKVVNVTEEDESEDGWRNIRIAVNPAMIHNALFYCTKGEKYAKMHDRFDQRVCGTFYGSYGKEKARTLMLDVMPKAIEMHVERLKVKRTNGREDVLRIDMPFDQRVVRDNEGTMCDEMIPPFDGKDGMGIPNTDFVIYLGLSTRKPGTKICTYDKNGRPTSAIIKLNPREIKDSNEYVRVVAHEIAHGLGFNMDVDKFQKMVRGEDKSSYKGHEELNHEKLNKKVSDIFGCREKLGMRMDKNVLLGEKDLEPHFDGELVNNELMVPLQKGRRGLMRYSELTLAVFEATEHYKPIYEKAEKIDRLPGCRLRFLQKGHQDQEVV